MCVIYVVVLQVFNGNINTIDGCATFFRRDRFSHVKKYEVRKSLCCGVMFSAYFMIILAQKFNEHMPPRRLSLTKLHSR